MLISGILALLFFALIPGVVWAQSGAYFDALEIDLWPEYDRPEMLVIYRITLGKTVKLPTQVQLRIPASAGEPYNVAMEDTDGMLYVLNYTSEMQGEWLVITFTTPAPVLQIEYYDPGLRKEGSRRTFEYRWPGDYAVKDLNVVIQQPLNAQDLKVVPDIAGSGVKGSDGLVYYHAAVGELQAGTPFILRLQYLKADEQLSAPMQAVQPVAPLDNRVAGRSAAGLQVWQVLLGIGLVVVIIGIGGWVMLGQRQTHTKTRPRSRHGRTQSQEQAEEPVSTNHCPSCGRRVHPEDNFCRACGARLR